MPGSGSRTCGSAAGRLPAAGPSAPAAAPPESGSGAAITPTAAGPAAGPGAAGRGAAEAPEPESPRWLIARLTDRPAAEPSGSSAGMSTALCRA